MIAMPATKPYPIDSIEEIRKNLAPKITNAKLNMTRKYLHCLYDEKGGVNPAVIRKEIEEQIGQEFIIKAEFRGEGTFTFMILTEYEEEIYSGDVTFF